MDFLSHIPPWGFIGIGVCLLVLAAFSLIAVFIGWSWMMTCWYHTRINRAQARLMAATSERGASAAASETKRQTIQAETELKRLRADQLISNRQSDERIRGLDRERAELKESDQGQRRRIVELERQIKSITDKWKLSEAAAKAFALEADEAKQDAQRLEDENRRIRVPV